MSFSDFEEPLSSLTVALDPVGEGDEFHTRNASPQDFERQNVIRRLSKSVNVHCELIDVQHGHLGADRDADDLATLLVLRFRFDPQDTDRRVIKSRVNIEFFSADRTNDDDPPVVEAIAPNERWSLLPTKDQESVTRGGELSLGVSQIVSASGKVTLEKSVTKEDVTDATVVTGFKHLATGKDAGEDTCASWTLLENKSRKSGVPNALNVALLLSRENDEPFNAKVTIEAECDFTTNFKRFWKKVPLDDPILFNPKAEPKRHKRGRSHGGVNLGGLDLYSFCDATMSAKAFWAIGASTE
ncbi:hypothetical protein Daus18300_014060 [Diaporthe australafricana]|uniref:C2 NT-type domain-containing protein n=1 Tax=Diaporthe australafricana TaxID=127596 RepID=A0ABR3VWM2_9PEZI